jgi:SpoVK/Ycf46/Vps4 family AAA+-type ATPase
MSSCRKSQQPVVVIAAAKHLSSVNTAVLAPGLLDVQVEIAAPDRHARVAILRNILQRGPFAVDSALNVKMLERELEGFSAHDLQTLAVRAAAAAASRALRASPNGAGELSITDADLRAARDGFVPPALRGAQAKEQVYMKACAQESERKRMEGDTQEG